MKTKEVRPGKEEIVKLSFSLKELFSYDEETASYILEQGNYIIRVGNSSVDTKIAAIVNLDHTAVVRKVKNVCGNSWIGSQELQKTQKIFMLQ